MVKTPHKRIFEGLVWDPHHETAVRLCIRSFGHDSVMDASVGSLEGRG